GVGIPALGVELGGEAAGEVPFSRRIHAGAEGSQGGRQGVRPVRRLEHRAQGDRPRELARKPQQLGIPPRGARLAQRDFRRSRLGGRVAQSLSKAPAVHPAVESVDLSTIGIFTLVGLPYVWKFLWAPAMDRFVPPFLGRRRGWLLLTQLALAAGIAGMAFLSPRSNLTAIAWLALFVAFASASQDIVVDAYRTDVVSREERGLAG